MYIMSDSEEDNVRIHVERRAPRPKVRFAAPQVFPVHNSYIPERHAVVNHFRRDESPSSTSSSDYDRPARRRARREPSPSRVKAQRMAWETEMMRNQLVHLQFEQEREADQRHLIMERRDHEEMRRARHELREGKERESLAEMEKRVKKEFEKEILEKTMKEKEAKEKREKEAKEAVERYKLEEAEKALKEMEEKEAFEKMYKSYLEQHLAISGLDEKHVKAIMNKERIEDDKPVVVEERLVVRKHHPYPDSLREFAVDCDRDTLDDDNIVVVRDWEHGRHNRHIHKHQHCDFHDRVKVRQCKEEIEITKTRKRKHGKRALPLLMYLAGYR